MAYCFAFAAVVCTLASATVSGATELVVNGGFETGSLAPFTSVGVDIDSAFPNTGLYDAVFDGLSDPSLSQVLATTPGQGYALSFALIDVAPTISDTFTISFGSFSQTILGIEVGPPGDLPSFYTAESFFIPGADTSAAATSLSFQAIGEFNLDDISVTAASAIPEPGSWAMMLLGMGLLGALGRRRAAKFPPPQDESRAA
jgi:hypothetical protein